MCTWRREEYGLSLSMSPWSEDGEYWSGINVSILACYNSSIENWREIDLLDYIYPHFMGGCSLTRETDKWLKEAGSWTKIELDQPIHEPSYQIMPHELGVLTKWGIVKQDQLLSRVLRVQLYEITRTVNLTRWECKFKCLIWSFSCRHEI